MEWISVKDRLPCRFNENVYYSEDILFIAIDGEMFCGVYNVRDKEWDENTTSCGCCSKPIEATHWMPLPNPPADP